jgi:hypothetical protein
MGYEGGSTADREGSASMSANDFRDIVDLARYPIDAPGSAAYLHLVETARDALRSLGACVFEGFVRSEAVDRTLQEVDPLEDTAFVCNQPHNVFLVPSDPAYAADHARNRQVRSKKAVLADDEISTTSPLRSLYNSVAFRNFIRSAVEVEGLFPFEDKLASLNVNFYGADQELGWHFDNSKFAVTIMLRQADEGGEFEFVPNVREESPAGYDELARILDEEHRGIRELKQGPGALVLFRGSRSLHRVTPCHGQRSRVIGVLSYSPEAGATLKPHTRQIFYGREN